MTHGPLTLGLAVVNPWLGLTGLVWWLFRFVTAPKPVVFLDGTGFLLNEMDEVVCTPIIGEKIRIPLGNFNKAVTACVGLDRRHVDVATQIVRDIYPPAPKELVQCVLTEAQAVYFRRPTSFIPHGDELYKVYYGWAVSTIYSIRSISIPVANMLCDCLIRPVFTSYIDWEDYQETHIMGYESPSDRLRLAQITDLGFTRNTSLIVRIKTIFPALTSFTIGGPLNTLENMWASLSGRVLGPTVDVHPSLGRPTLLRVGGGLRACWFYVSEYHEHPLGFSGTAVSLMGRGVVHRIDVPDSHSDPLPHIKAGLGDLVEAVDNYVMLVPPQIDGPVPPWVPFSDWQGGYEIAPGKSIGISSCLAHGTWRMKPTNTPADSVLRVAYNAFKLTHPVFEETGSLEPLSFFEWVARYPRHARKRLYKAFQTLVGFGWCDPAFLKITNFIKRETSVKATIPRNISPHADEGLVGTGPYISAIEKRAHKYPFVVKGLSPKQRDAKLSVLFEHSLAIEIDQTKYDRQLNLSLLTDIEEPFLREPFGTQYELYHQMVSNMHKLKGVSRMGTRYEVYGRASGSPQTSIANSIIHIVCLWLVLHRALLHHRGRADCFAEGDDFIGGVTGVPEHVVKLCVNHLSMVGLLSKIKVSDTANGMTFCGRYIAEIRGAAITSVDWLRALSKFHTTVSDKPGAYVLLAKGLCGLVTDSRTPLVGPLCRAIVRYLRPKLNRKRLYKIMHEAMADMPWLLRNGTVSINHLLDVSDDVDVLPELRALCFKATGMSPQEQMAMEKEYALFEWGYPVDPPLIMGEMEPDWWDVYTTCPIYGITR